jgi:hypothetical protein
MKAEQFPALPIPGFPQSTTLRDGSEAVSGGSLPPRQARLPNWPRLLNERLAAAYLSIGTTLLRDLLPPKKIRGRSVWDLHDLDRLADALAGQPLDGGDAESHGRTVERAWLEKRAKQGKGNGG